MEKGGGVGGTDYLDLLPRGDATLSPQPQTIDERPSIAAERPGTSSRPRRLSSAYGFLKPIVPATGPLAPQDAAATHQPHFSAPLTTLVAPPAEEA